ncbi:MAG: agmatine deiminase family protein [Bacteroidia bacterium]
MEGNVDTLYFSSLLPARHPVLWNKIGGAVREKGIRHFLLDQTADIWARDYMPIQVGKDKWVLFGYQPGYLKGKYEDLRTDQEILIQALPIINGTSSCEIRMDGGNLIMLERTAIVTDRIYRENKDRSRSIVRERIMEVLGLEKLIVIPHEPFDFTGHADGMIRFINPEKVFLADYRRNNPGLWKKLISILGRNRIEVIPFPYCQSKLKNENGDYTAIGCYINYLRAKALVVLPQYGLREDEKAANLIRLHLNIEPVLLNATELAQEGGVFNCIHMGYSIGKVPKPNSTSSL